MGACLGAGLSIVLLVRSEQTLRRFYTDLPASEMPLNSIVALQA